MGKHPYNFGGPTELGKSRGLVHLRFLCSTVPLQSELIAADWWSPKLLSPFLKVGVILFVQSEWRFKSLGFHQSAAINNHPDYSGTLHRNLNASVPDPTFPTHTKEKWWSGYARLTKLSLWVKYYRRLSEYLQLVWPSYKLQDHTHRKMVLSRVQSGHWSKCYVK